VSSATRTDMSFYFFCDLVASEVNILALRSTVLKRIRLAKQCPATATCCWRRMALVLRGKEKRESMLILLGALAWGFIGQHVGILAQGIAPTIAADP